MTSVIAREQRNCYKLYVSYKLTKSVMPALPFASVRITTLWVRLPIHTLWCTFNLSCSKIFFHFYPFCVIPPPTAFLLWQDTL